MLVDIEVRSPRNVTVSLAGPYGSNVSLRDCLMPWTVWSVRTEPLRLDTPAMTKRRDTVEMLEYLCNPMAEAMPDGERLTLFVNYGYEAMLELKELRARLKAITDASSDHSA